MAGNLENKLKEKNGLKRFLRKTLITGFAYITLLSSASSLKYIERQIELPYILNGKRGNLYYPLPHEKSYSSASLPLGIVEHNLNELHTKNKKYKVNIYNDCFRGISREKVFIIFIIINSPSDNFFFWLVFHNFPEQSY